MTFTIGRITRWIILFVITGVMIVFHSCMSFRMSSKEIAAYFESNNVSASQHSYKVGFRDVHYVKAGDASIGNYRTTDGSPERVPCHKIFRR